MGDTQSTVYDCFGRLRRANPAYARRYGVARVDNSFEIKGEMVDTYIESVYRLCPHLRLCQN